jgi:Predicted transcriptional regulators
VIKIQYYEVLRALRQDKDLNQTEMAKILSVSQRSISHYESGKIEPPYSVLIAYAKYFHVTTDYILGLSEKLK